MRESGPLHLLVALMFLCVTARSQRVIKYRLDFLQKLVLRLNVCWPCMANPANRRITFIWLYQVSHMKFLLVGQKYRLKPAAHLIKKTLSDIRREPHLLHQLI